MLTQREIPGVRRTKVLIRSRRPARLRGGLSSKLGRRRYPVVLLEQGGKQIARTGKFAGGGKKVKIKLNGRTYTIDNPHA